MVLYAIVLNKKNKIKDKQIKELVVNVLQECHKKNYISVLATKYKQCFYRDEYGDTIFDNNKYNKDIQYFFDNKLSPVVEEMKPKYRSIFYYNILDQSLFQKTMATVLTNIRKEVENYAKNILPHTLDEITDPITYETAIADVFVEHGWQSFATQAGGDQGADVIAQKGKHKIIVQCKLYSQPVGNKAVQEVASAKTFYDGTIAIVVTNASYTKSAKQLANSCNVKLLHHDELQNWLANFQ